MLWTSSWRPVLRVCRTAVRQKDRRRAFAGTRAMQELGPQAGSPAGLIVTNLSHLTLANLHINDQQCIHYSYPGLCVG